MPVFLRVKEDHRFRDVAVLSAGTPVMVGRSPEASVSFPQDIEMSSRHAEIELQGKLCHVRDLGSTNGTFLNDELVQECSLGPGDLLRCGGTVLCLELTEADRPAGTSPGPAGHQHHGATATAAVASKISRGGATESLPEELQQLRGFSEANAAAVCSRFQLQELIATPPEPEESPAEYATRLLTSGDDNDCLYFLAWALPKRMAVWWLIQCIRTAESLKLESDPEILAAAEAWVRAPSDESRRKAMGLADAVRMESPACWTCVGAFWSHGSMGPPDQPAIPAPDNLAGKAIGGGAILAAVIRSPEKAPQKRQRFVELALEIASGELSWQPRT